IDIDPALIATARPALQSVGYQPTLAAGHGYDGLPAGAPYDRIIATCAINHIPPQWIRQLNDRGRIVAPLFGDGCGLMVLDKTASDEVVGRFDSYLAGFMPLRQQLTNPLAPGHSLGSGRHGMANYGTTNLDPRQIADATADLLLFLHLHIPGLRVGSTDRDEGSVVVASSPTSHADVSMDAVADLTWPTVQRGPQRLWDTIEHAARLWHTLGNPGRQRLGITALDDTSRQYVWLDDPNGPYSWTMPL
ncbi:MAG TPA: hypothetical protein VFE14_01235, partial [Micromonosporaceae bacterium]|nr:hypothetical protein [Micromonosporaceae bacterium]